MNNILEITKINYIPPHTHMGRTLQENCKFEAVDKDGKVVIFSAFGNHAKKMMRKIVSKKKVVCFCSFSTFTAPLKNEKGVTVLDNNEYPVLTTNTVFTVKRILDYNPKANYIGTDRPVWIIPFLFTYPKVSKRKLPKKPFQAW